ncbi:MAG: biotin--[acetyl-CoA-carboxylase] ligase [Ruminococcaceae bacterium]|nr:biotin--[acetyl-CoA-carboxylase] ligase [Oscillospiraceae bacterium]
MIKITEENIKKHLCCNSYEFEIFDKIDSTNTYARNVLKDGKVIISDMQKNGRGRMGRSFYSPEDNGIYMSVVLKVDKEYSDLDLFTVAIASITLSAIEKVTGKNCFVKWVNDIFLNDKKVSGILCENVLSKDGKKIEYIIIGIGINVKSVKDFPMDLKDIAGCIEEIDRNILIAEILKGTQTLRKDFNLKKYLKLYKEKSMVINKNISFFLNSKEYSGKVEDINDKGNLVVRIPNGDIKIIKSGEIRLNLNDIC